jgi:hypothetical protein
MWRSCHSSTYTSNGSRALSIFGKHIEGSPFHSASAQRWIVRSLQTLSTTCLRILRFSIRQDHSLHEKFEDVSDTRSMFGARRSVQSHDERRFQVVVQALRNEPHTMNGPAKFAGCLRTFQRRTLRKSGVETPKQKNVFVDAMVFGDMPTSMWFLRLVMVC